MRPVLQVAILAAASTLSLAAPAQALTRRAAAVAATVSPERAALLSAQPTTVDMVQTAEGWIKTCPDPAKPDACAVAGAFAIASGSAPNLRVTIEAAAGNGTRPLGVTLPIDVALRPGFTIMLENGQAILGDYTTCGALGCSGEVGLSTAAFQQLMRSKRFGILIGNATDRALRLTVALDGFAPSVKGRALSEAELAQRRETAAEAAVKTAEGRRNAIASTTSAQPVDAPK